MNEPHPWADFLESRGKCIMYFKNEHGKSDKEIAEALSINEDQVFHMARYLEALKRGDWGI